MEKGKGEIRLDLFLRMCPLFYSLSNEEIDKIKSIAISRRFNKHEIIFSEGDPAETFYVAISGRVKIYKVSPEGREQILHMVFPGDSFAEAAMFMGKTYPASSQADLDTEVLAFRKEAFVKLIKDNTQLTLNLLASLSRYLRLFLNLVEELSLKDVSARVAKYLLDMAKRSGAQAGRTIVVELDITKTQLASILGTISETLSRTLKKLSAERIIKVEGKKIIIIDKEYLEEISAGMRKEKDN